MNRSETLLCLSVRTAAQGPSWHPENQCGSAGWSFRLVLGNLPECVQFHFLVCEEWAPTCRPQGVVMRFQ